MIEEGVSHIAYFRLDGGSCKLYTQEYVDGKDKEIERLNKIIKRVSEILNNKRDEMITQRFDCDFEELLYQIDEEIREVIKSDRN